MILGVGRLRYQKGFQYLIKAYETILKTSDEYQGCIVGPEGGCGKEFESWREMIIGSVFTGPIPK